MNAQDVTLPTPSRTGGMPLMEALALRSSNRDFSAQEIDSQTLSNLLWAAWGYNRGTSKRTAPSSHNRQEIEVYVALSSGTYIYDAAENILKQISKEDIREFTGSQDFVKSAPVNLIFVADISKITGKSERATYETAYVNTGYISQNVGLFCASAGLSNVPRAMVDKETLAQKIALRESQIITLCHTVGWPKQTKSLHVPLVEGLETMPYEELRETLKSKGLRQAIDVVNWPNVYSYCPGVSFSIARSATHIFVSYMVSEKSIRAVTTENGGPVHEDSCVEFFLQIPGDKYYFNFETNCIGAIHAAKRLSRNDKTQLPADMVARIIRYTSVGNEPFESKSSEEGFKYNVIMGIPFDVIGLDPANLPKKINANFYKCGDKLPYPHYLSWNPIKIEKPDFHRPDFFGEIEF